MRNMWRVFSSYINPLILHFPLMLWSGDFVAKGEKGDCVALQEEGTSVYTRFTPSSGLELLEVVLLCFGQRFSSWTLSPRYHCIIAMYFALCWDYRSTLLLRSRPGDVVHPGRTPLSTCCLYVHIVYAVWFSSYGFVSFIRALYAINVNVIE